MEDGREGLLLAGIGASMLFGPYWTLVLYSARVVPSLRASRPLGRLPVRTFLAESKNQTNPRSAKSLEIRDL
jgi:hypothetical protein